jgi:hypothetical protein
MADPAGWPGKAWLKTRLQPVDSCFFFFTKTMSFWFFKKNWPGRLGDRVLDRAGHRAGSKNYDSKVHFFILGWKRNIAPLKNEVREREYLVLVVVIQATKIVKFDIKMFH